MKLGELIDAMKTQKQDAAIRIAAPIDLAPTRLDSYRGYYEDLAIGFEPPTEWNTPTVGEFLLELEGAIGKTYCGWKGGEFLMGEDTIVWVATVGESSGARVRGVESEDGTVWITLEMGRYKRW